MTVFFIHALASDYFNFSVKKSHQLEEELSRLTGGHQDIERSIYIRVWSVALGIGYVEKDLDDQYKVAWDAEIMDILYAWINRTIEEHMDVLERELVFKNVEYTFNLIQGIQADWDQDAIMTYYYKVEELLQRKKTYEPSETLVMNSFSENLHFNVILSNYWRNFFMELDAFLSHRTVIN